MSYKFSVVLFQEVNVTSEMYIFFELLLTSGNVNVKTLTDQFDIKSALYSCLLYYLRATKYFFL